LQKKRRINHNRLNTFGAMCVMPSLLLLLAGMDHVFLHTNLFVLKIAADNRGKSRFLQHRKPALRWWSTVILNVEIRLYNRTPLRPKKAAGVLCRAEFCSCRFGIGCLFVGRGQGLALPYRTAQFVQTGSMVPARERPRLPCVWPRPPSLAPLGQFTLKGAVKNLFDF